MDGLLAVDQTEFILPLIVNHKRGRVDQYLMKTIQPVIAETEYGQAEQQRQTAAFQFIQLKFLQRNQTFLT
ncbi:hypothetical protein D3C71_2067590 [compost metagenome]